MDTRIDITALMRPKDNFPDGWTAAIAHSNSSSFTVAIAGADGAEVAKIKVYEDGLCVVFRPAGELDAHAADFDAALDMITGEVG